MMTGGVGGPTACDTGQIAWQRRAAAALGKILERATAEALPPIAWAAVSGGQEITEVPGQQNMIPAESPADRRHGPRPCGPSDAPLVSPHQERPRRWPGIIGAQHPGPAQPGGPSGDSAGI